MHRPETPIIAVEAPDLPYTLIRCISAETAVGSDRITTVGRADLHIFSDGSIVPSPPQQLLTDPLAPQRPGVVPSCTPLTVAQAVWTPEPPAIVCTHGARAWELVAPAVAGRIARLDTGKLARLIWPGLASHTLDHLCSTVTKGAFAQHSLDQLTPLRLGLVKLQLLVAQIYARGTRLLEIHPICCPPDRSWIGSCMSDQRGDPILQAGVDLSLLSMPPLSDPRPEWHRPDGWRRLAAEELDFVLGDPTTSPEARAAGVAEYRRREDASRAASVGLTITRRSAPRSRDTAA